MNDTYLGIDLGTSSMKMVLTDSEKHILGQISEEYEAVQSQNGWSEIDPEIWFQAMRRGMHNIFEDQDPKFKRNRCYRTDAYSDCHGGRWKTSKTGDDVE